MTNQTDADETVTIDQLATVALSGEDLTPDRYRGIVEEIEAQLDGSLSCRECGARADVVAGIVVAPFPDPAPQQAENAESGRETAARLRCHECYASLLSAETTLSETQAAALALVSLGFSHSDIADVVGRAAGTISSQLSRAKKKREKAQEEIEERQRTIEIVDVLRHEQQNN